MKKLLVLLLTAAILFSAASCGKQPVDNRDATDAQPNTATDASPVADPTTETSSAEQTASEDTTASETPTVTETAAAGKAGQTYLEPTEEDFAEMEIRSHIGNRMLTIWELTMLRYDPEDQHHAVIDFDPATADARDVLFYVNKCQLYDYYFGEPETVILPEDADPFSNPNGHEYLKYDIDKLDWVAKNALNLDSLDMASMTAENEYGYRLGEYKDGFFYVYEYPFGIESGFESTIKNRERLDDGSYRFEITYRFFDMGETMDVSGEGTLIAGLKEVDGKRVWSALRYQADLHIL